MTTIIGDVRFKRGNRADLPTLNSGEPGLCEDTGELFVGSPSGNILIGNNTVGFQTLTVANADRIGFIGDSYTESNFAPKGKAYISKLSLFSDYNFESFAKSGDTYRGNLDRIRKKTPIYHSSLSWQDFKPKYAFLTSYTNDMKIMDAEQYGNDLRATIETVKSLGALPIVTTEYHSNYGSGIQSLLRQIAREYNAEFVDIIPKVAQLRGTDYAPFWGGSHAGARTNHLEADNYEKYLSLLPRPRQSLKVFRVRPGVTVNSLDDLIFNKNEERAKKFKEINVGHSALNNAKEVDNCTNSAYSYVTSEYLMLQNHENVPFTDYALVSAVLPSTSLNLNKLRLVLNDTTASVYVKNIIASPYSDLASYPVGKQNIGHWQQISLVSGKYDVPLSLIANCVDYDKVHFLIKKTGNFNLNNISIEWAGQEDKVYKIKDLSLQEPTGTEMLAQPFIGNTTQLSSWTIEGTTTTFIPADNNLPSGAVGCANVDTINKVKQSFSYTNPTNDVEFEIKVWARNFPTINDPQGATFTITEDSYDYAELAVDLILGASTFTLRDKVGLHWKEVTFKAYLPVGTTSQTIRVYSGDKTIQLAKVSAKVV